MEVIIKEDGTVWDQPSNRQVGYFRQGSLHAGGNGVFGGRQVGYIRDDAIYEGGNGTFGGRQIGYLKDGFLYVGGHGTFGGRQFGKAVYPHPRQRAAIDFLLR